MNTVMSHTDVPLQLCAYPTLKRRLQDAMYFASYMLLLLTALLVLSQILSLRFRSFGSNIATFLLSHCNLF